MPALNRAPNERELQKPKIRSCGRRGVSWVSGRKKWKASICVDNRVIDLGFFKDKQDAVLAREEAEMKYLGVYRRKE